MTASCACFAATTALGSYLGQRYSPLEVVFFRNLFMLLALLPLLAPRGWRALKSRRLAMHGLRALITVLALEAFYVSIVRLPIAEATALNFTVPLFLLVLSVPLLHERVGVHRWAATLVGFAGVLVMLRPGLVPISAGALLALLSALGFALSMILIRRLAVTESSSVIVFYQALFMVPLSGLPAAFVWSAPDAAAIGWFAALGVFSLLAQFALARALAFAESSALAPFDFTRLPFAALLGYVFFAQVPSLWTWLGAAAIAASALYLAQREARRALRPPRAASNAAP